jgi:hypothetical protein
MPNPRKPLSGPGDPRHGTEAGYVIGCRQSCCRAAHAAAAGRRNAMRRRLLAEGAEITHGLKSSYDNWGCKCEPCAAAAAAYRRDLRASRAGVA